MSLILEALRKSEAERRRGQVPGLHAELPPAARPARPQRAPWPWLAATAVITIVAATWLLRDKWAPAPPADEPARASTERTTSTEADRVVADDSRADTARSNADAAIPATEPMVAAPSADIAAVAKPERSTTATTPASTAPVMVPRQPPEPVTAKAPNRDPASGREPVPVATESSIALPPPRPTTTHAVKPPTDASTTAVDDSAPLRLSDLSAVERRTLPPLQVSMHMWAPTSTRRFAIIDGARINEGDRLGEAVVDEITRDGVVLAWHGRRVHIPIH